MPMSVFKAIGALQLDEDWTFRDLPMPYDIKIKYDSQASPGDMYKVNPSPRREAIPADVLDILSKKPSLDEVVVENPPITDADLERAGLN